jgi:aspartyl-tRNA(Asn)/glutamyl-tRNA(Gln) amidotransferase subunit B
MQKGHMRFEPNINLAITRDGRAYRTPITEVKNLNSFRAVERSVEYEIQRQLDEFLEHGTTMEMGNKTTRGWDDDRQMTVLQREKEEAHDYRYFPEPDLLPVKMNETWLAEIRSRLCELPLQMQQRFMKTYELSAYDAGVLTADRATAEFFDEAVKTGGSAKRVCNLLTQIGMKMANDKGVSLVDLGVSTEAVAKLANMADHGDVNASAGATIFEHMAATGKAPDSLAEELNLVQKSDSSELEVIVKKILADNPQAVEEAKSGSKKAKKAQGFLLGQVMQQTQGQANPRVVSDILGTLLKS